MTGAKTAIAELVTAWAFHRDQEAWDELLGSFHEDGTISLSWFDGPYRDFVAASKRLASNKGAILKHRLGTPRIVVNGSRALSEVDVTIMVRAKTPFGEVDTTSYARFLDLVEARGGEWKIWKRTAVYEKDRADPVDRGALPDAFFEGLERHPAELKFLAGSLARIGTAISSSAVRDKSRELEDLQRAARAWLASG